MKLIVKVMLINFLLLSHIYAADKIHQDLLHRPYDEIRATLINKGWQPVFNTKINETSLYAQEIANRGYAEVLNCISMERDQCEFLLKRNKRTILVITKEKGLEVESIQYQQK